MRPKRAALWVWLHKVMRNNDFSLPGRSYIIGKSIGSALSSLPSCLCHCRCSVQTMRHGKQLQPMESTLLQVFAMVPVPPPQATMSISMVVRMDQSQKSSSLRPSGHPDPAVDATLYRWWQGCSHGQVWLCYGLSQKCSDRLWRLGKATNWPYSARSRVC